MLGTDNSSLIILAKRWAQNMKSVKELELMCWGVETPECGVRKSKESVLRKRMELIILNSAKRSKNNPLDLAVRKWSALEKQCQWGSVDESLVAIDSQMSAERNDYWGWKSWISLGKII